MTNQIYHNYIIYGVIILLISISLTPSTMSKPAEQYRSITNHSDGNILFSPMSSTTTYLINYDGEIMHTWPNSNLPGYSVYLLENGNILRAAKTNFNPGGMVQEITWNGDIIWEFIYDSNEYLSHHDIEPLPNGNVLMIAYIYKTVDETTAAGHNPIIPPGMALTPDHIIEVEPTGTSGGNIVWEWHVWDHLIQDYDPSKDNYGIVADHPELIDINFAGQHSVQISDWTHINSIDYNENLNQILRSITIDQAGMVWLGNLNGGINKINSNPFKFKTHNINLLIGTDVAARGLDIDNISHVFNYDIPKYPDNYIHRIGRTSRMSKKGVAITLCLKDEYEYLCHIEGLIGKEIKLRTLYNRDQKNYNNPFY